MSNYYGGSELLYSHAGLATVTTPTAGPVSLIAGGGYEPAKVPANYMRKLGSESSSLKFKLAGQMTVTATVPTWLVGLVISSAQPPVFPTPAAGNTLAATATFTPTVGTAGWCFWDIDIVLSAIALGAASTVETTGQIEGSLVPSGSVSIPATNVSSSNANWETDLQYFIWPYLTLGAATAGNTFTTRMMKLYGEN